MNGETIAPIHPVEHLAEFLELRLVACSQGSVLFRRTPRPLPAAPMSTMNSEVHDALTNANRFRCVPGRLSGTSPSRRQSVNRSM